MINEGIIPAEPNELGTLRIPAPSRLLSRFIKVLKNVESLDFLTSTKSSKLELELLSKSLGFGPTDSEEDSSICRASFIFLSK